MTGPLILGIESATARVGCAIGDADGVAASAYSSRGRRHAESLAPQIRFVLDQAGVTVHDIAMIAVDVGPGLYTGLRVGITTARAMAQTLAVPMIAVSSLEAIAQAACHDGAVGVAIDARRGEVFHAAFTVRDGVLTVETSPAVAPPTGVARSLVERGIDRVVGDGAIAYESTFAEHGLTIGGSETAFPLPDVIVRIATDRTSDAVDPVGIEPMYLRRPDAVAKWEATT